MAKWARWLVHIQRKMAAVCFAYPVDGMGAATLSFGCRVIFSIFLSSTVAQLFETMDADNRDAPRLGWNILQIHRSDEKK